MTLTTARLHQAPLQFRKRNLVVYFYNLILTKLDTDCIWANIRHICLFFRYYFPLYFFLLSSLYSGCNENDADHLDRDQQSYPPSQKTKRMRTSFKHHQLRTMKSYFAINHNPDAKDLKQLAQKTGLTKRVLQVRVT